MGSRCRVWDLDLGSEGRFADEMWDLGLGGGRYVWDQG